MGTKLHGPLGISGISFQTIRMRITRFVDGFYLTHKILARTSSTASFLDTKTNKWLPPTMFDMIANSSYSQQEFLLSA